MTLKAILVAAVDRLEKSGIDDASFNVDLLAASLLRLDRSRLPLLWNNPPDADFVAAFNELVERRAAHEPLQYILGSWSFLDFSVVTRPGALIPRPETEDLFMATVAAIKSSGLSESFCFADVCTGSGILGIALLRWFPAAKGFLSDISAPALAIARENIENLIPAYATRAMLLHGNLLQPFMPQSLDLVIANPPYVGDEEIPYLMPEVKDHEPIIALAGGNSGLDLIEKLIAQAMNCLRPAGILAFEHGHGQRQMIIQIIEKQKKCHILQAGNDLAGRERFFIVQVEK